MNGMPMLIAAAFLVLGSTFSAPISSDEDVRLEMARLEGTEFSAQTRQRPRVRIERDQPAAYDYPRPGLTRGRVPAWFAGVSTGMQPNTGRVEPL